MELLIKRELRERIEPLRQVEHGVYGEAQELSRGLILLSG